MAGSIAPVGTRKTLGPTQLQLRVHDSTRARIASNLAGPTHSSCFDATRFAASWDVMTG